MNIRLSGRLQAVADLVPHGARVIDVGTDHAMLPVWLIQNEIVDRAWASDIRPGPLQSARRLVRESECEDRVFLRLTDGLSGFGPEDTDTVIIAGMGGETMMNILRNAPWTVNNILLILEPQSKQALLRKWMLNTGYSIFCETLVEDGGRIYPILMARGGEFVEHTPAELHVGRTALIGDHPLFGPYLDRVIHRLAPAGGYDAEVDVVLKELKSMKERL